MPDKLFKAKFLSAKNCSHFQILCLVNKYDVPHPKPMIYLLDLKLSYSRLFLYKLLNIFHANVTFQQFLFHSNMDLYFLNFGRESLIFLFDAKYSNFQLDHLNSKRRTKYKLYQPHPHITLFEQYHTLHNFSVPVARSIEQFNL